MAKKRAKAKPGPKPAIDDMAEAEILAVLTVGGSLRDAAEYVGIDYKTLYNKRKADDRFSNRVNAAVAKGKYHHLKKINDASQWQASAFMLERKWPEEFARRERIEHTGANGGAIQTETTMDLSRLSLDELRSLRELRSKAQTPSAS